MLSSVKHDIALVFNSASVKFSNASNVSGQINKQTNKQTNMHDHPQRHKARIRLLKCFLNEKYSLSAKERLLQHFLEELTSKWRQILRTLHCKRNNKTSAPCLKNNANISVLRKCLLSFLAICV